MAVSCSFSLTSLTPNLDRTFSLFDFVSFEFDLFGSIEVRTYWSDGMSGIELLRWNVELRQMGTHSDGYEEDDLRQGK